MTEHELKIWPEYFKAVREGKKTFEVRKADRDYKTKDVLYLREWNPDINEYTGKWTKVRVGYILEGPLAVPGLCIMAIEQLFWRIGESPDESQSRQKDEP